LSPLVETFNFNYKDQFVNSVYENHLCYSLTHMRNINTLSATKQRSWILRQLAGTQLPRYFKGLTFSEITCCKPIIWILPISLDCSYIFQNKIMKSGKLLIWSNIFFKYECNTWWEFKKSHHLLHRFHSVNFPCSLSNSFPVLHVTECFEADI
jgi:hypothetical protein